eukprot:7628759-Pyramimonas_sp.AAC.1
MDDASELGCQSNPHTTGIFSRRTNHTQEAHVCTRGGPITQQFGQAIPHTTGAGLRLVGSPTCDDWLAARCRSM